MTSRERVEMTLSHREPDRIPLDLGSSAVTGMHVSTVYKLRQALHLDSVGTPVKVIEPYQMLGEIGPDLMEALGVDVVGVRAEKTMFGYRNEGWKPWTTFDGTPVLVPDGFNTEPEANGDLLAYPEGDKSAKPSGRMPEGGYYFDSIVRQPPIDDQVLDVKDNLEEFDLVSDQDVEFFRNEVNHLYASTNKAILVNFGGTAFGDIALVPAPWLKDPKGIRDVSEWYMSTVSRRDYVFRIFERQCEIALENLRKYYLAVGDKPTVIFMTGTDFGTQLGPFISPKTYCDLYQPFQHRLNDWIHTNTPWKTFIHSCGSVRELIPHFIDAGFDILNPVQCSATGMDANELKAEFGERITFWGGAIDTQHTLPFGSPEQVSEEVTGRIRVFAPRGGFVFNTIHNVQPRVPVENVLALYNTFQRLRDYPVRL